MPEDYGPKHERYAGYKALAYLHPARFRPEPGVRAELGLAKTDPYHIVRFVDMTASHDYGEAGLPLAAKRSAVELLQRTGRVFISSEARLPDDLAHLAFPLPASRLHHALASAATYAGDSQTMAEEAAVLGIPSLRCTTWAGRLHYLNELEHRYGLVESFRPADAPRFLERVEEVSQAGYDRASWQVRRTRMLNDKVDVTTWYRELVTRLMDEVRRT
jgi:hypothetical protein